MMEDFQMLPPEKLKAAYELRDQYGIPEKDKKGFPISPVQIHYWHAEYKNPDADRTLGLDFPKWLKVVADVDCKENKDGEK